MPIDSDLGPQRKNRALSVSQAESELAAAVREYCRTSGRMFPTWGEILEVARGLGHRRPAGREEIR